MYYEINVSYLGRHLFATHKRSVTSEKELGNVLIHLLPKFPRSEGYEVSITQDPEVFYGVALVTVDPGNKELTKVIHNYLKSKKP